MAKKCYVGVNGIAKNVSKMYVGVNGVPKKVLKAYVGVNGVPKLFWDGGGYSITFDITGMNVIVHNYGTTQVNFTSAIIEPVSTEAWRANLGIMGVNIIYDSARNIVGFVNSFTINTNTASVRSFVVDGYFVDSGTEFYLGDFENIWKISNVSFANNETCSFEIIARMRV